MIWQGKSNYFGKRWPSPKGPDDICRLN